MFKCVPLQQLSSYHRFRAKMNEKYMLMTPWGVMNKILGPYAFSPTARETLGDKMDLYFQDHSFVPMFMQVTLVDLS